MNGNPTRKRGSLSFPVISLAKATGYQRIGITDLTKPPRHLESK